MRKKLTQSSKNNWDSVYSTKPEKYKIIFNSPVIITFTILSFIVLILSYVTLGTSTNLIFSTSRGSLLNPLTYLRMFTYILGHSGFQHWFNNFLLILVVGPSLEEKYGSKKLLSLILITAFATALVNNIFFTTGLVGASGIAFMMILLSSFTNAKNKSIPFTFILVAIMYLGQEIFNCLTADDISQFAHIFGGIVGSVAGFVINKK